MAKEHEKVPAVAKVIPGKKPIVSAVLTIAQIQKQGVRVNVIQDAKQEVILNESSLMFSRNLLPGDYEFSDGKKFRLVISEM